MVFTLIITMIGITFAFFSMTGQNVTYTVLVWLQETGATKNVEHGGKFKAGVRVTTGGNSTGVTGILENNGS